MEETRRPVHMQFVEFSSDGREWPQRRVDGLQLRSGPVDEILVVVTSDPDTGSLEQRRALVKRREQVANANQLLTWQ